MMRGTVEGKAEGCWLEMGIGGQVVEGSEAHSKIRFAKKISIRVHRKTFLPRERESKKRCHPFPQRPSSSDPQPLYLSTTQHFK